ncbi:MAG: glycosyltransferase family 4 protein, partial [Deltaproteobacteria bacterium]|nr:glycosyltransferase family 4 protein [Deltaproteobacteria bacterium]
MDGIPEAQLFILGDGPRRGGLEELARRQSCRQRIHFTGHVSRPQVFEFLRRADVFVLNSTYEGLPHIVLEAMLAGVPVIATDVGGTGELVINNHNGLLVPPGSPQLLRTAITQLLNDKALRERLQRQASETLTQFTWERLVNETEQILNDAETHA